MDDARQEHGRQAPCPHQLDHGAKPADPLGLMPVLGPDQGQEVELRRLKIGHGDQREPVARGRGHEVERERRLQPVHKGCRGPARVIGGNRRLEEDAAVGETAEVEALRAGIDPDHARHQGSGRAAPAREPRRQLARATP